MKILSCIFLFLLTTLLLDAMAYTVFEENGKVGLKNAQGQVIIPPQYDALGWSNGSFSVVENVTGYFLNNRWGLLALNNRHITDAEYDGLLPTDASLIIATKKSNLSLRQV